MATIQEKKDQFLNQAKQKVAEIGYSMVDQRETGQLVFNDAYHIDELLSGIEILSSPYCGLSNDDTQAIIDYLDYKYCLSELPINVEIAALSSDPIILSGQSIQGPKGDDGYTPVKGVDYFDGSDGTDGDDGLNAWIPEFALVADGIREVQQVVDWFGGGGTKPATGLYVGVGGFVGAIGDGINVKGSDGNDGNDGNDGIGINGLDGWTPVLSVQTDGSRRVHQITNWVGGTTTKPDTGGYIGSSGIVTDIADAVDIRGQSGDKGDVGPQGIKGESGFGIIDPIQAATTGALTTTYSAGALTATSNGALANQDGVSLAVGERLLVKDQAVLTENGIYEVSDLGSAGTPYILTRTSDFNSTQLLRKFPQCFVEEGIVAANTNWTLFDDRTTLTLDVSDLTFGEQEHPLQNTNIPVPGDVIGAGPVIDEAIVVEDGVTGKEIKQSETVIVSATKKIHTPVAIVSKDSPTTEINLATAKTIQLIADAINLLTVENDSSVRVSVNPDNEIVDFLVKTPSSSYAINVNATSESVGIYQSAPNANTSLDIGGGRAVLMPRLSTGQRDGLTAADGMMIYNITTGKYEFRQNGAWDSFSAGSGVSRVSATLTSWTLSAGTIYYSDFVHNIGTLDVVETIRDNITNKKVQVEEVEALDTNTLRVYIEGNTAQLRITAV